MCYATATLYFIWIMCIVTSHRYWQCYRSITGWHEGRMRVVQWHGSFIPRCLFYIVVTVTRSIHTDATSKGPVHEVLSWYATDFYIKGCADGSERKVGLGEVVILKKKYYNYQNDARSYHWWRHLIVKETIKEYKYRKYLEKSVFDRHQSSNLYILCTQ